MPLPNVDHSSVNSFPSNLNPQDAHLHATLERIDQLANEDVEMQAPLSEGSTFLVLDTNILLHHFDVLSRFVQDIEDLSLSVIVIIPGAVIYELDGQKNRDGLAWFARRASAWLLKKVKERKFVKGQANEETCKSSGNWKVRTNGEEFGSERINDALILDCCQFFALGRRTILCSADKNLCVESETAGITTISPSHHWSSREVAKIVFGSDVDLNRFGGYHASYKDPKSTPLDLASVKAQADDDGMDIDDDASMPEILQPSHALDLLHIQVIDHFTRLLIELVGRVGGPEIHRKAGFDGGVSASRYAPQWQSQRDYLEWNARECLEYLTTKTRVSPTSPRVDIFLSKPYSCGGARRGQDWSRKDWEVALGSLWQISSVWEDVSIRESLGVLDLHLRGVFATRMRPTGI